jgi:AraC-like DNA-binding protein
MKLTLEQVKQAEDRSFHILLTPGLNDFYYWHFHPEVEIVFIDGATGTRHIGDHISRFEGSDLVLIGSNIPHLNFDYGVTTDCKQVVVQMKPTFTGMEFFNLPEMQKIKKLFERADGAIIFHGRTKEEAGQLLKELPLLDSFGQLLQLLKIFACLTDSAEYELIEARPVEDHTNVKEQQRLRILHRHVEEHYREQADSHRAAALVNLSTAAFCRYFKKATGHTYTDYVNKYRINQARKLLLMEKNVTEACFECGYENLSHFNRTFRRFTGENPSTFRKRQGK